MDPLSKNIQEHLAKINVTETESDTEAFDEAITGNDEVEDQPTVPKNEGTEEAQRKFGFLDSFVEIIQDEITVVTIGKETPNQAFFCDKSDLDSTLDFIRNQALPSQGLSLPKTFKFMTSNKNIIPLSKETTITLKRIIYPKESTYSFSEGLKEASESRGFPSTQDFPWESAEKDSKFNRGKNTPQLLICSMRSKKKKVTVEHTEPQTDNDDIGSDGTNEGEIEGTSPHAGREADLSAQGTNRCPMHSLNRILFNIDDGPAPVQGPRPVQVVNWKKLIKALVGLQCALVSFVLLFALSYYCLTCTTGLSLFPYMSNTDDMMTIKMKLSQLEVNQRHRLQELQTIKSELVRWSTKLDNIQNQLEMLESKKTQDSPNAYEIYNA